MSESTERAIIAKEMKGDGEVIKVTVTVPLAEFEAIVNPISHCPDDLRAELAQGMAQQLIDDHFVADEFDRNDIGGHIQEATA